MRFSSNLPARPSAILQEISDYWFAQAGEGVALRVVTGILETIIMLSSQPMGSTSSTRPTSALGRRSNAQLTG
jgi:hypothetical protein